VKTVVGYLPQVEVQALGAMNVVCLLVRIVEGNSKQVDLELSREQ
jgi:hypothetical protein